MMTTRNDQALRRPYEMSYPEQLNHKDAEIERLRAQRNDKAREIVGWKRTALAMRDEAIHWMRDGKSRYDEIEMLYFNAAMFGKFALGDAFANEQSAPRSEPYPDEPAEATIRRERSDWDDKLVDSWKDKR